MDAFKEPLLTVTGQAVAEELQASLEKQWEVGTSISFPPVGADCFEERLPQEKVANGSIGILRPMMNGFQAMYLGNGWLLIAKDDVGKDRSMIWLHPKAFEKAAPTNDTLEPLDLWEACEKVGCFFDQWQVDPREAEKMLRPAEAHPLRNLFKPCETPAASAEGQAGKQVARASAQKEPQEAVERQKDRIVLAATLMVVSTPQIYVWSVMRGSCATEEACEVERRLHSGGALLIGVAALAASLTVLLLGPRVYKAVWHFLKKRQGPQVSKAGDTRSARWKELLVTAQGARQGLQVSVVDKFVVQDLPHVFGCRSMLLFMGALTLISAFAILGALTGNGGLLALGERLGAYLLTFSQLLVGEKLWLRTRLKQEIIDVVWENARRAEIDIDEATFKDRFESFLKHSPSDGCVKVDLWLIVALSACLPTAECDCVRLRNFLVLGAGIHTTVTRSDPQYAHIIGTRDVLVDVVEKTYVSESEDDIAPEVRKLPYHLALTAEAADKAQWQLVHLGVRLGSCALLRHQPVYQPGCWEAGELQAWKGPDVFNQRDVDEVAVRVTHLTQLLFLLCANPSRSSEREARMLLAAGALVNQPDFDGQPAALFNVIQGGKDDFLASQLTRMLIDHKADLSWPRSGFVISKCHLSETSALSWAKQCGREYLARLIEDAMAAPQKETCAALMAQNNQPSSQCSALQSLEHMERELVQQQAQQAELRSQLAQLLQEREQQQQQEQRQQQQQQQQRAQQAELRSQLAQLLQEREQQQQQEQRQQQQQQQQQWAQQAELRSQLAQLLQEREQQQQQEQRHQRAQQAELQSQLAQLLQEREQQQQEQRQQRAQQAELQSQLAQLLQERQQQQEQQQQQQQQQQQHKQEQQQVHHMQLQPPLQLQLQLQQHEQEQPAAAALPGTEGTSAACRASSPGAPPRRPQALLLAGAGARATGAKAGGAQREPQSPLSPFSPHRLAAVGACKAGRPQPAARQGLGSPPRMHGPVLHASKHEQ